MLRTAALLLPILVYLPALAGGVPYPPGDSSFTDLLISHYPNLVYLKQALLDSHQLPLWNSQIYSGTPFAADPLAGLFYLPGWLAMIFPMPWGIILVSAAHSVLGAWGMFSLLKRLGLEERSSLLGGIWYGTMPKLAAHFGAGHISLLYSLAWTPWLFAIYLKDRSGWRTGVVAGMLFLADPRWAVYAGLLFIPYTLAYRQLKGIKLGYFYLKSAGEAFLIGSPLIIPLLDYLPLSTRSSLQADDILKFGLPPGQLIGLIIPGNGGNIEWYLYGGGGLLALSALALVVPSLRARTRFWYWSFAASLLISLSLAGGAGTWISRVPVVSLLRVPSRGLFLAGFCLAILAAFSIQALFTGSVVNTAAHRFGFIALVFASMLAAGLIVYSGGFSVRMVWGLASLGLAGLVLLAFQGRVPSGRPALLLSALITIDLIGAGWMAYQVRPAYQRVDPSILERLTEDGEPFRTYSPSYSIDQSTAAVYSLELADGIDPMQIAAYRSYLAEASGVPVSGYTVSIPEFRTGNPDSDNAASDPDPDLLGMLNVKYLISEFPIDREGWTAEGVFDGQYLYTNGSFLPRAWVENPGSQISRQAVAIISRSPNRIELEAEGPGRLVLSEVYFPGWRVKVDGSRAPVTAARRILRGIQIPGGSHRVVVSYQPLSVYAGMALGIAGWLIFGGFVIWKKH